MIVEGYTLHLYCDFRSCGKTSWHADRGLYGQMVDEYGGKNKKEAWRQAKERGWIKKKNTITCPNCMQYFKKSDNQYM